MSVKDPAATSCASPMSHAREPEWLGLFKARRCITEGVDYLACWREAGGAVLVFDSNGDLTPIPVQAFTKDEVL
jgi:hypothetical protein